MSYVLTEDEYSVLDNLKHHLGMLTALSMNGGSVELHHDELCSTFSVIRESIVKLLNSMDERNSAETGGALMTPIGWWGLIRLVSGYDALPKRTIVNIDECLQRTAEAQPEMKLVFDTWRQVVTNDGKLPMMTLGNGLDNMLIKFERPQPPHCEPATEASIASLYGVKSPQDVCKAIVAMVNGGATEVPKSPRKTFHTAKQAKQYAEGLRQLKAAGRALKKGK